VTPLARTALDVGREHGFWAGTAAVDSALRSGAQRTDFHKHLRLMKHWPYIRQSKSAVEFGDPGAENAGESMSRILVGEVWGGQIQTQFPIRLGSGRVVWIDLMVGCHAFEFDGKLKFRRKDQGGVAERDAGELVWDEKERQRLVCAESLGMSRIIWADFWGSARVDARKRLTAELGLTRDRCGERRPPQLDEFAERMADERRRRIFGDWRGGVAG
jgi:hypothetical protein